MESVRKHAFTTLLSALTVVALLALPGQSGAATPGSLGSISAPYSNTIGNDIVAPSGTAFTDDYTFNLLGSASFNSIVATFNLGSTFGVTLGSFNVNLYDGVNNLVQSGSFSISSIGTFASVAASTLAPGAYDLRVTGTTAGSVGTNYGGSLQLATAPIPEPETYAMMLAGLGLIGFVARRKKQKLVA